MPDDLVDILPLQDAAQAHSHLLVLWPRQWQGYTHDPHAWQSHRLAEDEAGHVPDRSGVYTLLIQPGIAGHPACSHLMYVGRSGSLRRRFREYLGAERRSTGRPKIFRLLNRYSDYLWFCFAEVPENQTIEIEDALMAAYLPPHNDQLPAHVRAIRRAF